MYPEDILAWILFIDYYFSLLKLAHSSTATFYCSVTPHSARNPQFNKEIRNRQWCAYSKGVIKLCKLYPAFASKGRSMLVNAPKDMCRIEALGLGIKEAPQ